MGVSLDFNDIFCCSFNSFKSEYSHSDLEKKISCNAGTDPEIFLSFHLIVTEQIGISTCVSKAPMILIP